MASVFGTYRKPCMKHKIPRKRVLELIDMGKDALQSGNLGTDPYTEEIMNAADEGRGR